MPIELSRKSPVARVLDDAAELAESKFAQYGNVYDQVGEMMTIMYPNGMQISNSKQATLYSVITWILCKLCRYATSKSPAAQEDSLKDLVVYAAMAYAVYKTKQENTNAD